MDNTLTNTTENAEKNTTTSPAKPASLREDIQTKIVELITKGLETGTISEERARSIAKLVLEKLPDGTTDNELMHILPHLDDEFTELSEIVLPIVLEYEEKIRRTVEDKVVRLVRARKFKEALDMARKGIEYSSKLSAPSNS